MGADRLKLTLSVQLAAGGTAHAIPSGNVRAFDLELFSYGLQGSVEFLVEDRSFAGGAADALLADFLKPDLMSVSLTVQTARIDIKVSSLPPAVAITGLVSRKSFTAETYTELNNTPILHRTYRLEFMDPARLLWRQHHPCELYTTKAMKDVLDAHKGDKITLTYNWTQLTTQLPMIFVGLDPVQGQASFYDFVMWYVDTQNGVFTYDYATPGYVFAAAKDSSGTAVTLYDEDVERMSAELPEVPRYQTNVVNTWTEGTSNTATSQAQAATGMRQDILLRTPIAADATARSTLETNRLTLPGLRVRVDFSRVPQIPLVPGTLVNLIRPAFWTSPAGGSGANQGLRINRMELKGRASAPRTGATFDDPDIAYDLDVTAWLEAKTEPVVSLPAYSAPAPFLVVEGKIVSESGADTDLTYQIYTDSKTSLQNYKVMIPAWTKQQITTSFLPNLIPGHFYFPLYKNERVLVGLHFLTAEILGFLDWRDAAALPADGQGDQLLLGKSPKSSTSLQHFYDNNNPVFEVLRTNQKDIGSIQIQEGQLIMTIKENS